MIERFVHDVRLVMLPPSQTGEAMRVAELRAALGARMTRRMSPLGLCITAALDGFAFDDDPAVIYSTTHTEAQALENYIDSFPHASPLLFQTSIHPGGIQQALIARQQAVTELFPLGGDRAIIAQALRLSFVSRRPRCVWAGGEERGTWLRSAARASGRTFAWAMSIDADPAGADARVEWAPEESGMPTDMTTRRWAAVLRARQDVEWIDAAAGRFRWSWS